MLVTQQFDGGYITYKDDQSTRDAVYEKVLEWFMKTQCFNGESIQQCDIAQIESPELLVHLADDVFEFDPTWE